MDIFLGEINSDPNKEILRLYKEYPQDEPYKDRPPLLYPSLNKNALVFIGLNPSYREDLNKFLELTESDQEKLITQESEFQDPYSEKFYRKYFGKIEEIAEYVEKGQKWAHLDLFFIRETASTKLKKHFGILEDGKISKNTDFAQSQISLIKKTLPQMRPLAIIVINALASKIIQQYWKNNLSEQLHNLTGCHFLTIENNHVPIFISGMLSGQHALDNGSFERLKWHIKKVVSNTQ